MVIALTIPAALSSFLGKGEELYQNNVFRKIAIPKAKEI
jgi:hypothetical protein